MGYSGAMVTNTAPDLTPGYPSNGAKLGPAWNALWAELAKANRRKDPYLDGRELADLIAPDYGLNPSTLVALLSRAALANLLLREGRAVQTARGNRTRTHYAIPSKVKVDV